jgi:hypothetical protein
MSEFKPKKDDQRAGEEVESKFSTGDSPKPHGDKLQHALHEAATKPLVSHLRAALQRLGSRNTLASTLRWWP